MGEFTDLIFTLLGKSGRLFNAHGKRVCFIIWIFCLLYWMARNYELGLRVQFAGCFSSIIFHIYGYYKWGEKKFETELLCHHCQHVQTISVTEKTFKKIERGIYVPICPICKGEENDG